MLGSDDSDDEDFKIGKKPVGQQAPPQQKPQNKLLMDSDEDDDSDGGFKPTKKPAATGPKAIAAPVTEKAKPQAAPPKGKGKNLFADDDDDSDDEDLKFKSNKNKKEEAKAALKPQAPASTLIPHAATAQPQKAAVQKKKTVKFMESDDEDSDDFKPPKTKPQAPSPKKAPVTVPPPAPKFDNPP